MKGLQDLEFSVLVALVLEDLLDGYLFTGFGDSSLKYNAKGPISYDLLCIIGHTLFIITVMLRNTFGFCFYSANSCFSAASPPTVFSDLP
jgi:hypothetical protein